MTLLFLSVESAGEAKQLEETFDADWWKQLRAVEPGSLLTRFTVSVVYMMLLLTINIHTHTHNCSQFFQFFMSFKLHKERGFSKRSFFIPWPGFPERSYSVNFLQVLPRKCLGKYF